MMLQTKPAPKLTPQQQAIVAHTSGPALVFAVAGSGKTTAVEHRIADLVDQNVFAAERILALAYNKDAAGELRARLNTRPTCLQVQVSTLHSLGFRIVRRALDAGYLPYLQAAKLNQIDGAEWAILDRAKKAARSLPQAKSWSSNLFHMDEEDFLTYVTMCKGNLQYPTAAMHGQLPAAAQKIARVASAPKNNPWYLDIYTLYEQTRWNLGCLTFDDQLVVGWEVFMQHPDLVKEFQDQHHCILVDEFQDVNLVQSELINTLARARRNLMVVGDDDQTIYAWRGASTRFILDFPKKFGVTPFFMTDNFRCDASQIVLANAVIRQNMNRAPKQLALTRGFVGSTEVIAADDKNQAAQHIACKIAELHQKGMPYREMAVLLRLHAQSASIEQMLMQHEIPHVIVGAKPFYQRPVVKTLIDYCRVAYTDQLLATGVAPTASQSTQLESAWKHVYWQPYHGLTKAQAEGLLDQALNQRRPLHQVVRQLAQATTDSSTKKLLTDLANDLAWLASAFSPGALATEPASQLLRRLETRLGYKAFVLKRSEFNGEEEAATIDAFIEFAKGKGNLQQFLQHVHLLDNLVQKAPATKDDDVVELRTIHSAKGLEWQAVFVPDCNEGIIPFKRATAVPELEEECRLLYVAITRARTHLWLYHVKGKAISSFLSAAKFKTLLNLVEFIRRALAKEPEVWNAADVSAIADFPSRLKLESYFFDGYWDATPDYIRRAAEMVSRYFITVERMKLPKPPKYSLGLIQRWREMAGPNANQQSLDLPKLVQVVKSLAPKK
jgi:DNA helicase-2/ATP-dependent DNA helicase PcrA